MDILVIEDHPVDRKLFHAVLRTGGHDVRSEVSAEQAIETISVEKPELLLLDLRLPGMNGIALVRLLRSSPKTRDLPIVVVTAYPGQFSKSELLATGCDDFWEKPVDTRTLSKRIVELVVAKKKVA